MNTALSDFWKEKQTKKQRRLSKHNMCFPSSWKEHSRGREAHLSRQMKHPRDCLLTWSRSRYWNIPFIKVLCTCCLYSETASSRKSLTTGANGKSCPHKKFLDLVSFHKLSSLNTNSLCGKELP